MAFVTTGDEKQTSNDSSATLSTPTTKKPSQPRAEWLDVDPSTLSPEQAKWHTFANELHAVIEQFIEKKWAKSERDFAKRVGLSKATLRRIFAGETFPNMHTVAHLEVALNRRLWPTHKGVKPSHGSGPGYDYP